MNSNEHKIAIIGLGYVGLPLAVEFGKKYFTMVFYSNYITLQDINVIAHFSKDLLSNKDLLPSNFLKLSLKERVKRFVIYRIVIKSKSFIM